MNKKILKSSLSSVFVFLAFLIAINFLVSRNSVYFDLTDGKIYTTSDTTKNILKNLKEEVDVNFYISKDLPQDAIGTKTHLMDFMNQYQDIAGSKLKVSYIEPENNQEMVQKLGEKGIPQIQFNVVEKDKYEVRQGFFGVEIVSEVNGETKREVIPIIQSIGNWEYDFISAIYSVSRENKETVAFLKGHGEKEIQIQDLQKSYNIVSVEIGVEEDKKGFFISQKNTMTGDEKNEEVKKEFISPLTLIIIAPTKKITKEEISVIDDFIYNGGNVIIASESIVPDLDNNLNAIIIENNLNELTRKYGIEINSNLIYDKLNYNITYKQGFFSVSKPYPFWIKTVQENFSKHPALSRIQSVIFPWASSLSLWQIDDYITKPMINSTSQAKDISKNYNLLPDRSFSFVNGSQKIIVASSEPKERDSTKGTMFVIGDSDFIGPNFSQQIPDNQTFFMNLVDSISNSVNLNLIRSKNIINRPIKDLDESEKNYWKFISIFASAILIGIYGVFRITKRKKKNR